MKPEEIKSLIESNLQGARAIVTSDDGHHYSAEVCCPSFEGKPLLVQHRMVYDAIGPAVGRAIHALALTTRATTL